MALQELEIYEFDAFELDARERTLRRGQESITLTPKVFDLLLLLVENPGKLLDKEFLLKTLWPDAFVEEANLSVNISTLRRALGQISSEVEFIETVPKRGYRFVAPVMKRGSESTVIPLVMGTGTASAALERVVPAEPLQIAKSARFRNHGRTIALSIFAAVVVALIVVGIYVRERTPTDQKLRSLAVLPFRSLTAETEEGRLGAGMSNALIQRIANAQKITVRPVSAVLKYANYEGDPALIGKELQVDAVLDGTIQREGDRIRVTVQLCRVRDRASLWAEQFDDYFSNIFAVQDSISEMAAKKLSLKLTEFEMRGMNKRYTESTEAYSLYLQGQYYANVRTKRDSTTAVDYFKRAIERDPEFALAYAELAAAYINLAGTGQYNSFWEEARRSAEKAVELDKSLSQAHLSLGRVYMRRDWNWAAAETEFRTAVKLDGNSAAAHAAWSTLLTALARHEEAITEMQRACELDPQSGNYRSDLAWTYYCARRNNEAIQNSKLALLLDARSDVAHRQLEKQYLRAGRYEEAIRQYQLARDLKNEQASGSIADLALIYSRTGRQAEADQIYRNLQHLPNPETISNYSFVMAKLAASLGHVDEGVADLKRAQQQRLARAIWMGVDPEIDSLRSDPRVIQLLKESKLVR